MDCECHTQDLVNEYLKAMIGYNILGGPSVTRMVFECYLIL